MIISSRRPRRLAVARRAPHNETVRSSSRQPQAPRRTRKGTNGVTANFMFSFLHRGTFWVLPLAYFYIPKSARAYLFPQSVKIHYFCSGPISVDPICPQPTDTSSDNASYPMGYSAGAWRRICLRIHWQLAVIIIVIIIIIIIVIITTATTIITIIVLLLLWLWWSCYYSYCYYYYYY